MDRTGGSCLSFSSRDFRSDFDLHRRIERSNRLPDVFQKSCLRLFPILDILLKGVHAEWIEGVPPKIIEILCF